MSSASLTLDVFTNWDNNIQQPFANGISGTVSSAISAVSGPVTSLIVLWIIISGILAMRGDITARTAITRIVSASLVTSLVLSSALYNTYVVSFFVSGIPDFITSSLSNGTAVGPDTFYEIFKSINKVFAQAENGLSITDVVDGVLFAILDFFSVIPVGILFLFYELTKILLGVVVCIGPFVLPGYLFAATRGIADRFIGKLVGLSILMLLINIVLSIIDNGINTYVANVVSSIASGQSSGWFGTSENVPATLFMCFQLFLFLILSSLIMVFIPGIASFIGGGISVSPMEMATAAKNAVSGVKSLGKKKQ